MAVAFAMPEAEKRSLRDHKPILVMTVMEKRRNVMRRPWLLSQVVSYLYTHLLRVYLCGCLCFPVSQIPNAPGGPVYSMARSRRRTGRTQKTPDPTGATDDDSQMQGVQDGEVNGEQTQDDKCPACKDQELDEALVGADKEQWVRCDACKIWFHWRCAGEGDLDAVDKWYVSFPLPFCECTRTVSVLIRYADALLVTLSQVLQTMS